VRSSRLSDGRVLACTRCGSSVLVHELPRPFIDPARYVCDECKKPVDEPQGHQLELVKGTREETRDYDPLIAEIPF
jgi:DNA-directed RNA polymerase subunit RPC12/RpoP